ncbi:MAG: glycosyltransferase family 92 protein [Paludibacteraceae bacterium]|nr:glycosyltransferase family 92 protein [Paludibacteraceae bacterium]
MSNHNEIFYFNQDVNYDLKYRIKVIVDFVLRYLYKLILFFCRGQKEKFDTKYNFTICAIFKDEANYIKEWILYHQMIGVEHFYLYNNFSSDQYESVLKPFVESGMVTLTEWPIPQGQIPSYKHWYENFRKETKWNCFLDLDEYICPLYGDNVYDWVKKYEDYPTVKLYWRMFGTSGKMQHDDGKLVTEQYVVSWDKYYDEGKIFYNTSYKIDLFELGMMHNIKSPVTFLGKKVEIPPINEFKNFITKYNINKVKKDFTIQVNHYWSKALNCYFNQQRRGDAVFKESPRSMEYFYWHESKNRGTDYSIYRFLIKLKSLYEQ